MNATENGFRAPLPEELAPLFPSYQILSLIARGGMGAVYHAIQTSLEREIAIKILPVEFGDDPEFCKSFETEAKAMAKLNHPNLISVYDFGEVNGMLFIAMEYVPGQSLYDAYHGAAVDPAEVIRLMTGISQGLAHAHGHGILHRDIKPANILLDSYGQPKIGDFGLARHLDTQVQDGETIYGTPGYTAPEVVEQPLTVDQRADVFSLGVLLHELLTGRLPASDPRPPSMISRCDPRFDAVVSKATHHIPSLRYQKTAEITEALQKIASSTGSKVLHAGPRVAPRPTVTRGNSKKPSKHSLKKKGNKVLVTPVAIPLLLVGMVVAYFYRDQIFPKAAPNTITEPIIVRPAERVAPGSGEAEPEPVKPEPKAVVSIPELIEPAPSPGDFEPAPASEAAESVTTTQPKYDVEGFLAHARSVMAGRCGSYATKRDEALKKNISDFRSEALSLLKENLPEKFHLAGESELDAYVKQLKKNGYRIEKTIQHPLKHKKYLVELNKKYLQQDTQIDGETILAFAEPQKTYLYGLEIKLKALQEADDLAAANLIKAEIDKVSVSPGYFPSMMQASKKE
jgi:serine/threonine protein kinase